MHRFGETILSGREENGRLSPPNYSGKISKKYNQKSISEKVTKQNGKR